MKPEAMRLTMPNRQHDRQHFGAARHAVTEIAAIGDDMHLRHRHGDAAADAGDAEQHEQRYSATRQAAARGTRAPFSGHIEHHGALTEHQRQRQHRRNAEQTDADDSRAASLPSMVNAGSRRPDRTGKVIACRGNRHGDAAPPQEPVRDIGDHRTEGRRRCQARSRCAIDNNVIFGRQGGSDIANAETNDAQEDRRDDAAADGQPSHETVAEGKAEHRAHRVWQMSRPHAVRRTRPVRRAKRQRRTTCRRCRWWQAPRPRPAAAKHSVSRRVVVGFRRSRPSWCGTSDRWRRITSAN